MIDQIRRDMYHGDWRKPGVTTRLEELEARMDHLEKGQISQSRKLDRIIWLLITTLIALVVEMAIRR